MTDASMFWCPLCRQEFPASIESEHDVAHGQTDDRPLPKEGFTTSDGIFWALCLALGVIAALLVAPFVL